MTTDRNKLSETFPLNETTSSVYREFNKARSETLPLLPMQCRNNWELQRIRQAQRRGYSVAEGSCYLVRSWFRDNLIT